MNGKELLEAMSYVDEKYIDESEAAPAVRRFRWKPVAAIAASLAIVLFAARLWIPTQLNSVAKSSAPAVSMQKEEAMNTLMAVSEEAAYDSAPLAPATAEMTVRLLRFTEDGMVCAVLDPGTSSFQEGTELFIAQADTETRDQIENTTLSRTAMNIHYRIVFSPELTEGNEIQPIELEIMNEP